MASESCSLPTEPDYGRRPSTNPQWHESMLTIAVYQWACQIVNLSKLCFISAGLAGTLAYFWLRCKFFGGGGLTKIWWLSLGLPLANAQCDGPGLMNRHQDTKHCDKLYLTCSQKLMDSQLHLLHSIKQTI